MTNIPTEDGKFGDLPYDEVIVLDENDESVTLPLSDRTHEPVTAEKLADWRARTFPALARQRAAAASTPIDDELPENPQNHLDELH